MRRFALPAAALAALALAVGASGIAARPSVRVPDLSPFTVRGFGFRPHEQVRVVVHAKSSSFRRAVDASPAGSFRLVFRRLRLAECKPYAVRATGARGSLATTKNTLEPCGAAPGPTG